jgi:hypothetical protein
MEDYFEEAYYEDSYRIVYEILEPFDHSFVTDTEDLDEALSYHERGYFINEHRIQKMLGVGGARTSLILTIEW